MTTPAKAGGGFIYFLAIAATVLWAGGLTAYTLGFRSHVGPFEDEPFAILILYSLYRRYRRHVGPQEVTPLRMGLRVLLLCGLAVLAALSLLTVRLQGRRSAGTGPEASGRTLRVR